MGLYDEIRVEHILPGNTEITDAWYQTKSFYNTMSKYVISANGELYEETWEYEWVDSNDHFFKGYLNKIEGTYKRDYLTDYHGDVKFYTGPKTSESDERIWRDYYARFTDGRLSKMWYKDSKF